MDIIKCIKERRSIRKYSSVIPSKVLIVELLEISKWTPSGKNQQPWRVQIIDNSSIIHKIGALTPNSSWIVKVPMILAIYLDKERSYNYLRDSQSCGAFIQTFMLSSFSKGLSTCWVGEILNCERDALRILRINNTNLELMALIAIGYSDEKTSKPNRRSINEIVI